MSKSKMKVCQFCKTKGDSEKMLYCPNCDVYFHRYCALKKDPPGEAHFGLLATGSARRVCRLCGTVLDFDDLIP